ncbi:hypothetical protein J437_LFUL019012 [Ladona fulva]|uniref:ATP-dependent DNA helicase n=1 Tax=Ladona fulva TaxID=123851 RepID=A0A8K0KS58_LADFU|nr:hypothetical protein J437_LFUL019012 [Ladona fulva]
MISRRGDALQRISETHRSYDALQYPIIFWGGDDGYHFNFKQIDPRTGCQTNRKISAMEFYAYKIMVRSGPTNHILLCKQLFRQFNVDMYAKVESERLLYIRLNQSRLRIQDICTNTLKTLCHMFGRPDLFVTFTCNPTWAEITEELLNGQAPSDRHDLTARVFKQKLSKLMDVITKCHIYGDTRCWMYSIEWQKRGLPHAHILVWLKEKIRPTQIDEVISAALPNEEDDPILFEIICKNMIHGPCETQTGNDGYPLYRRRKPGQGGHTASMKMKSDSRYKQVEVDNRWVVPYTPLLSKMFEAHINVEYCNSVKSIKYICKYINKGSDMAIFQIENENRKTDEITQYQMGRYISSNEAVWRILNFSIHERYPPVIHLSVHLENGQRVYFTAENARERAARPPNSTLTAFFLLCQEDPFARTLLYPEVSKYYTWNKSRKLFCKRKQGVRTPGCDTCASEVLGRVYTVHPNNSECYYLRLLLHTVRWPTSFAALRTVDGEVCQTHREACQKRGLLLRSLFAVLITTCAPSSPRVLWEKNKESSSEAILREQRRANPTLDFDLTSEIFNEALILLEDKCISINGKTLMQLGLPEPSRTAFDGCFTGKELRCGEVKTFVDINKHLLTSERKVAHDKIFDLISCERVGNFFFDIPRGTRKTFLINLLLAEIRANKEIAVAVASSGIASTLLDGGGTAHSALQLPINLAQMETPVCNISKGSGKSKILKSCKILVWDECTMMHKKGLEALDRTMKDLRGNNRIMGGAVVVLPGDFRQTLPVIPRSTPADELNASLKASHIWTKGTNN